MYDINHKHETNLHVKVDVNNYMANIYRIIIRVIQLRIKNKIFSMILANYILFFINMQSFLHSIEVNKI